MTQKSFLLPKTGFATLCIAMPKHCGFHVSCWRNVAPHPFVGPRPRSAVEGPLRSTLTY